MPLHKRLLVGDVRPRSNPLAPEAEPPVDLTSGKLHAASFLSDAWEGARPPLFFYGRAQSAPLADFSAGMGFVVDVFHALGADVGVDLGRAEILVAQQFLHAAQVGAVVKQMGRERMA